MKQQDKLESKPVNIKIVSLIGLYIFKHPTATPRQIAARWMGHKVLSDYKKPTVEEIRTSISQVKKDWRRR